MMFFSFECSEIHINLTIASQAHLQRLGLALNSDSLLARFDGINEPAAFFDLPTVALSA
jgi:hypothetical protein